MNSKISELDLVSVVDQNDVLPIVNDGITKKVKVSQLSGKTNLTSTQTATNFTINSDTGNDATIPLGNGTLAGASLNDYTTSEKNKLQSIPNGTVYVNAALSTGVRVTHTGTTVNTVLATLTIPANWISEFGIYHVIVGASRGSNNFSSPATLNVNFSGTGLNDDFIRGVNIGNVSSAKTNVLRTIIFRNGNREMFYNSGNFYSDLGSLQQNQTIAFNRTIENTLQVSITLTNSSDVAFFDYLSIVKVSQ
jgi:hypothetical protein